MAQKLRAVRPGEVPQTEPPTTLVEAAEGSRREFLVMARKRIASEIDLGVPAHALGRLIAEMDRLDGEVRRLDAAESNEGAAAVTDSKFDASAI